MNVNKIKFTLLKVNKQFVMWLWCPRFCDNMPVYWVPKTCRSKSRGRKLVLVQLQVLKWGKLPCANSALSLGCSLSCFRYCYFRRGRNKPPQISFTFVGRKEVILQAVCSFIGVFVFPWDLEVRYFETWYEIELNIQNLFITNLIGPVFDGRHYKLLFRNCDRA